MAPPIRARHSVRASDIRDLNFVKKRFTVLKRPGKMPRLLWTYYEHEETGQILSTKELLFMILSGDIYE